MAASPNGRTLYCAAVPLAPNAVGRDGRIVGLGLPLKAGLWRFRSEP